MHPTPTAVVYMMSHHVTCALARPYQPASQPRRCVAAGRTCNQGQTSLASSAHLLFGHLAEQNHTPSDHSETPSEQREPQQCCSSPQRAPTRAQCAEHGVYSIKLLFISAALDRETRGSSRLQMYKVHKPSPTADSTHQQSGRGLPACLIAATSS
jgi:hypothetical protein